MPSKKKKYNARFPAGRIKKIMQTDEEVGKVAQAVPIIISRTLELFVGSLLTKAMQITSAKNAKTLSPSHMKQCILSEQRFDFLKDLVETVQDSANGEDETTSLPIGFLPPAQNKSVIERRSSSSVIKEETEIKEPVIKKETISQPPQMRANCSKHHLIPNFYSEITTPNTINEEPNIKERPVTKQETVIKREPAIKKETISEPSQMRANCSTHNLIPNFYSEIRTPSIINEEPEIKERPVIKQETVIKREPAIKKEIISEPPQMRANCSTLHLKPNFYSEIEQRVEPEQRVSIHRPPVVPGYQQSQTSYQEPTRITPSPVLVMDEDYDTEINCS